MGATVAFTNQKGGTAKTTSVINLAGALAEMGRRVLVVDADPQASLTIGFGVDVAQMGASLYEVLLQQATLAETLVGLRENIDLAPANINLSVAELQLVTEMRREDRLRRALAPHKDEYDYLLVDCPPSLGLLNLNALAAADGVVVPMSCDYYALVGVQLLLSTIQRVQAQLNPELRIVGILPTRYDRRTLHAQEVLEQVRARLSPRVHVFDAVIRETVRLKETPIQGQTILEYAPNHPSAHDYWAFAQEFVDHV